MCFAMTCFFFLFSAIMIRVRSSKDPRAAVQNGWALYRAHVEYICWGMEADLHLLLLGVCCTDDGFVNVFFSRFWFFKFLILTGITVGAFFIPDGTFNTGNNMLCWITINSDILYCLFLEHTMTLCFVSDSGRKLYQLCLFPFHFTVWFYFGLVGSFIFILIQLILLIDFAHSWNKAWVENAENSDNKCWFAGEAFTWKEATLSYLFAKWWIIHLT